VARGVAYSRQAPSTQSVSWLAKENQPRRVPEVIGSTTGSLRVNCSHLKIKIKLRRQGQQGHIRQIAGQRLIICLSDPVYAALERKEANMQKSAVELSGELLEAIISSDIYEAVLDDDKLT